MLCVYRAEILEDEDIWHVDIADYRCARERNSRPAARRNGHRLGELDSLEEFDFPFLSLSSKYQQRGDKRVVVAGRGSCLLPSESERPISSSLESGFHRSRTRGYIQRIAYNLSSPPAPRKGCDQLD